MPKLTSKKPEGQSFAIPPKKMVVPPKTYSMTIPEFCGQLAFARHPLIEGELRIEEALNAQVPGERHFSEELVDTAQNVALRRASTASVCSAALYNAVHEGKLDFIHPMTGGRLIVTPHIRPEQEIDSSCKSPWQQEADKHQVRLTDLVPFAKVHDVEFVWADVENPMPRTRRKNPKTAAKHQALIDKACEIQAATKKEISMLQIAEEVAKAVKPMGIKMEPNSIREVLRPHAEQIYAGLPKK